MKSKTLGQSDLHLSRIGFGAWAIGGPWKVGWGPQDERESVRAIHRALDAGINWIDTAPVYGLGHSETVVGKALQSSSSDAYLFTKCGLVWDDTGAVSGRLIASSVTAEIDASLKRLGVDTIDLYQVHWPNPDEHIEEAWSAMAAAQAAGKLRYLGASNFSTTQLDRVRAIAPVTSLQPQYSMIYTAPETELLPYCLQHDIGVINYSPMGSGLLTGKMSAEHIAGLADGDWRKNPERAPHFAEPRLSRNLGLADICARIAADLDCTVPEVAIAWTLQQPAITAAIVGLRSAAQTDGVLRAADIELSDEHRALVRDYLAANP